MIAAQRSNARRLRVPERAPRRTLTVVGLWLASLSSAIGADVAVGHIGTRTDETLDPTWHAAFRQGAEEAGARAVPSPPPPEDAPAAQALQKGEDEYLKAHLRTAEKLLAQAVDGFLGRPDDFRADPAARALILLAEVQLANGRAAAAEKTLERGILQVPDFPGPTGALPPEVATLVARILPRTQPQLTGRLEVTADIPGVTVTLGDRRLGEAPLQRGGLPPRPLPVRLSAPGEPPLERVADLAGGPVVLHWASSDARRAALAEAAVRGDEAALLAAGADLEVALGAATSCVALVEDEGHALVVRFAGKGGRILSGHRAPPPDAPGGWRVLGRFCGPEAPGNLDAAATARRLRPAPETVPDAAETSTRDWVALSLLGAGVVAAGAGGYFAWQALDAQDQYDAARSPAAADSAADDARARAMYADIGFGLGAALAIAAGVLYWTDSSAGPDDAVAPEVQPVPNSAVRP
jgi:hypothetical protein